MKYSTWISVSFVLFGMALATVGARFAAYDLLLSEDGKEAIGIVAQVGSVRGTSSGYVDYIRYRFVDDAGRVREGRASGYSGKEGEAIRVEYSPAFPFVHRVSGEDRGKGYRYKWPIALAGLAFAAAGLHWLILTRRRARLAARLAAEGRSTQGKMVRLANDGRTIHYRYRAASGRFFPGKTLPLSAETAESVGPGDPVRVLYDPDDERRSVLELEL